MICLAGLAAAFPFAWRWWVDARYEQRIYALDAVLEELPQERVAIVCGARIYPSARLSAVLRDRADTAIALYRADKLLLSGDNRFDNYDEPGAMMAYAVAEGVPAVHIQPDYAGRRTYDTCYRAKTVFQVEPAVLVTQRRSTCCGRSSPATAWAWRPPASSPTAGPMSRAPSPGQSRVKRPH